MTNKIFSRKSLLPLVAGVLIGATVGGVGIVVATATTNTVTGCANKTTGILRYAADGKCKSKIENKIEWNQAGAAGAGRTQLPAAPARTAPLQVRRGRDRFRATSMVARRIRRGLSLGAGIIDFHA